MSATDPNILTLSSRLGAIVGLALVASACSSASSVCADYALYSDTRPSARMVIPEGLAVQDRTGHTSSSMINLYRRTARTAAELGLGELLPLDVAIPELRPTVGAALRSEVQEQTCPAPVPHLSCTCPAPVPHAHLCP